MKFLITGANGFLGKRLFDLFSQEFPVAGLDISNKNNPKTGVVDITDSDKLAAFINQAAPQVIIHAAAISSVDECEKEPEKAKKVNVEGTRNVALASRKVEARLIFTSSLNVYEGAKGGYSEEDQPSPVNVYGKTKLRAEKEVLKLSPKNIVLRLGTFYGHNGTPTGMTVEAVEKLQKGNKVTGSIDTIRNFSWLDDFPPAILRLLEEEAGGIYNLCSYERHSGYQFLLTLAKIFGFDQTLVTPAESPPHVAKKATMKSEKIKALGIQMHSLRDGLKVVRSQMEGG